MIGGLPRRHGTPRPGPIRATRPTVEGLEDRVLLYSTTGGRWTYPVRITYSIVPDGTSIGGVPEQPAAGAQRASRAGSSRSRRRRRSGRPSPASTSSQVADNGSPIGTAGNQQDDPRFGDIRIGGMAQSGGQLAFAYAPPSVQRRHQRRRHLLQHLPVVADQRHDLRPR